MLIENIPFHLDPRVRQEASALSRAGFSVSVICPSGDSKWRWKQNMTGICVYSFPSPRAGAGFFGYAWEYGYSLLGMFLISVIVWLREGFDILHAANPPDLVVFLGYFYKLFGKKFVFDHHDLAPELYAARFDREYRGFMYSALVWFEKAVCRAADHVIATNQSYKELEMQRAGVPEDRITIVRNGPNLDRLRTLQPESGPSGGGKTLIGYAGSIGFQDGVENLLRALHCLMAWNRKDFSCIVLGDGAALPSLRKLADELGLAQHLVFLGWVNPSMVPLYLRNVDICVSPEPSNPYNDRSTMIKVSEYMALGKPVVAFELPETRLTAGESALYAVPNQESDLAQKILTLMDDPARRKEMGRAGRERVEKELAWSHQKERLLAAYRKLLAGEHA
jgi:glycosyltransferase involved in cell wall biosynthesis